MDTHSDPLGQHDPDIDVGDAGIYVHADGLPVFDEYLLQKHPRYLASIYECIWHEMAIWSIRAVPAGA